MRVLRVIRDLPWWVGLPILLFGNLVSPIPHIGYIIGLMITLFGCWIFSKLLEPDPDAASGRAIIGIVVVALSLWFLDRRFSEYVNWSFGTFYALRVVMCIFGVYGFQGFKK
jgi:predicted permease